MQLTVCVLRNAMLHLHCVETMTIITVSAAATNVNTVVSTFSYLDVQGFDLSRSSTLIPLYHCFDISRLIRMNQDQQIEFPTLMMCRSLPVQSS